METTENTEVNDTTETSCNETTSTKEILIKGVVIPAMAVIVTQVVPFGVKKIAERVQARRAAKAAGNTNEEPTTD